MNPSMSSFSSATTIFGGLPARRGEQDLPLTSNNRLQQTALRRAARRNKALDRTVHDELCTTDCARWATHDGLRKQELAPPAVLAGQRHDSAAGG